KDDNHKPELMLALSEFWLLHGFRRRSSLEQTLQKVPELQFLVYPFTHGSYEGLYRKVMEMPQEDVDETLRPLLNRIIPAYQKNLLQKNDEHFWAARAALTFNREEHIDRGIFSIYFFNLLNLHPGEAIFQDAGLPHAYLEGQNIEIMANSDNVLRGGLTSKHIDVQELMQHIKFEETVPEIIHGQKTSDHELVFPTPAPDFELSLLILEQGETISSASATAEIFLLMDGEAEIIENDQNRLLIEKGEAFVSFHEALFDISAIKKSVICKASVPS
ncbi:MAG TPA: hypothetical protein VK543_10275, partial [Puia sp.]|nr:hypothetical protein [Puia sp.]